MTRVSRDSYTSAMLYQVGFQASLLCQESHIYGADYVMQTSNCIANYFTHDNKSLLIDNLPRNHNLC